MFDWLRKARRNRSPKTERVRELGPVDVTDLVERVRALTEADWDQGDARKPNKFGVLGATRHLVFRFVDDLNDHRRSHALPIWESWKDTVEPVLAQAVSAYGYARGAYPRVMLARLPAGGVIAPHIDGSPSAQWPHKIHVPVQTNPEAHFEVAGRRYHFEVGQAYEVNNTARHAAENRGPTDRIHLIFEYYELT